MLITVHAYQFIQFMSLNNSLFSFWSHTIELYAIYIKYHWN
jgi:hypothetical protein